MWKAICFARSSLVCMRYWTLKIYYCLISFTHSLLFVVIILFLILNSFSHCLSIVVSRPRLYLTSHGQCSDLWSLATCIGCWWGVVKWQSTCWICLLFGDEKHTEWAVTILELIVVLIIVTIIVMASSSSSSPHVLHAESGALGSQTATLAELLDRRFCTPFSLCSDFTNKRFSRNSTYLLIWDTMVTIFTICRSI